MYYMWIQFNMSIDVGGLMFQDNTGQSCQFHWQISIIITSSSKNITLWSSDSSSSAAAEAATSPWPAFMVPIVTSTLPNWRQFSSTTRPLSLTWPMELTTLLAPDLVIWEAYFAYLGGDFSLEEFDGLDQMTNVSFWFGPVVVPSTNCNVIFFFTVGLNVGAMSLVMQYDHGGVNPTDQRDSKIMNYEWCFEWPSATMELTKSHHAKTSLWFTLSTLPSKSHSSREVTGIRPFRSPNIFRIELVVSLV